MTSLQVAETIQRQLKANRTFAIRTMSWGMDKLSYGQNEGENLGFLLFKVNGLKFKGYVKISLEFNDTYKVMFTKQVRKKNKALSEALGRTRYDVSHETVEVMNEVYCDELNERIDNFVENDGRYAY